MLKFVVGENLFREVRPCIFVCLAMFLWEIPQHPYMVKAKRECEAEGRAICYHSERDLSNRANLYFTPNSPGKCKVCA